MIKVGLTGGIGSGKTYVAAVFTSLGIPVYNSDDRAKALMNESQLIKEALIAKFGEEVYDGGELNRPFLASHIFQNQSLLEYVNGVVHPVVQKDFEQWCSSQTSKYILKEAAILFEIGGDASLDFMVLVTAPEALRIERVQQRNGWTVQEIKDRISKQWTEERKKERADFCIFNDGQQLLLPQILKIHETLISQANS